MGSLPVYLGAIEIEEVTTYFGIGRFDDFDKARCRSVGVDESVWPTHFGLYPTWVQG